MLMTKVGNVARLLQHLVRDNKHDAVQGELVKLGLLAAPVAVELSSLLEPVDQHELQTNLCSAMTTLHRPSKRSQETLDYLSGMYQRLERDKKL